MMYWYGVSWRLCSGMLHRVTHIRFSESRKSLCYFLQLLCRWMVVVHLEEIQDNSAQKLQVLEAVAGMRIRYNVAEYDEVCHKGLVKKLPVGIRFQFKLSEVHVMASLPNNAIINLHRARNQAVKKIYGGSGRFDTRLRVAFVGFR